MPDWDAVYCRGWDPTRMAPFGTLTTAAAQQRDRNGVQYAVLLLADGEPAAMLHVAWRAGHLGVYLFDDHGRRASEYDYRTLDDPDVLYWRGFHHWRLNWTAEEFADEPWQLRLDIDHHDEATTQWTDNRGAHATVTPIPRNLRTIRRAPFGEWQAYLAPETRPNGFPVGEPRTTGPTWTPPAPLRPHNIETLFEQGTRFRAAYWPGRTVMAEEPYPAGVLHVPTGRLTAADPAAYDPTDEDALVIEVPPGDYPVQIAWAAEEVTAIRVLLHDEPVQTWEPALKPNQDPRMLPDRGYFGFDVDGGIGADEFRGSKHLTPAARRTLHWASSTHGSYAAGR